MLLRRYLPRTEFKSYEDFKRNYRLIIPEDFNFAYDIVDEWARLDPAKRALVWCDDSGGEAELTFADISRLSKQAANFFTGLGIKKGDFVLMLLRQRWEYWVAVTALIRIGAVFIPATTQFTAKDISYRVNAAQVKTILCVGDEAVVEQVEAALGECPSVQNMITVANACRGYPCLNEAISGQSDTFERPKGRAATRARDTMFVYFTSGTTGFPKMVRHLHSHPLGQIVTAKYWQRVQDGKLHMSAADSGWAKFGWGKIYGQWICGAAVFAYDAERFSAALMLEKLEKYRVTTFCALSTILRFMLVEDIQKYDLSSIEHCVTAGEPLPPEVFNRWRDATGCILHEGFGQTESSVLVANFEWFEPKQGSMGKPSPLYDIDIFNPEGQPCEAGEEGEIVVKGLDQRWPCGLFTGYYRDSALTDSVIGGGYYKTGDVAWRDSDGYYFFIGRNDDVIKCSGYRIGPFEVESALIEHEAVLECAVTASPDETRGQVVTATIVLNAGYHASERLVKELQDHVKRVTAPYKYPRIVRFVSELPRTVNGKIKRAEIRGSGG